MKAATPESTVLAGCLQLLTLRGVFHWRANQGAIPLKGGGYRRFAGMRGQADILAVLAPSGRLAGIECKAPGGRLSEWQRAFGERLTAAGGVYAVVSDVRELDRLLGEWGAR